jgi:hypothetical protein
VVTLISLRLIKSNKYCKDKFSAISANLGANLREIPKAIEDPLGAEEKKK